MNKHIKTLAFAFTVGVMAISLSQPAIAVNTFSAPEYIVEDQTGATLGGISSISFKGQVLVSMYNSTDEEYYWVQVFTTSGAAVPVSNLISEQLDVWYSGAGCTGTAYIKEPAGAGVEAALRGATYAIGRKAGATHEDSIVLRGSGSGSNNSGSMQSKFKASTIPFCTEAQSTSANTVVATQVEDLSDYVRPFKYR